MSSSESMLSINLINEACSTKGAVPPLEPPFFLKGGRCAGLLPSASKGACRPLTTPCRGPSKGGVKRIHLARLRRSA